MCFDVPPLSYELSRNTNSSPSNKVAMTAQTLLQTRPNSLIDTIVSNNGYRLNNALCKLNYSLSYPKSRDATASKNNVHLLVHALAIYCLEHKIDLNIQVLEFSFSECFLTISDKTLHLMTLMIQIWGN